MEGRTSVFLLVCMSFAVITVQGGAPVTNVPVWCAQGIEAYRKCQMIVQRHRGMVKCKYGSGEEACSKMIASGEADLSAFDGGAIFDAGKRYGLKVILSERLRSLAAKGTKYFAIAAVKKRSKLTFNSLKGARSCHTGVQKSSGWILPVGILLKSAVMPCVKGNQYASVAAFFNGSCAPGASNERYNKRLLEAKKLCSLCKGKCVRDSREPYYGYAGAFRCLNEDSGDVAFLKESVLTSLPKQERANYKLLCPDNSVADVNDYEKCSFARAPAHGVMTRGDATQKEIRVYQALLQRAAKFFRRHEELDVFDGKILSKSAIGLDRVPRSKMPYEKYLGQGYINAISSFDTCQ